MSLENKIFLLLRKKKLKISVAESCTGGMLSSSLTSTSGSSKVFSMGLVTYSNQAKIDILKVPKKTINRYGAVSYETCLSMLKNLSKISKSSISISITGVAGPKGGTKEKPVGLVYIGFKKGNKIIIKKNLFKNKRRIRIQEATVNEALKMILNIFWFLKYYKLSALFWKASAILSRPNWKDLVIRIFKNLFFISKSTSNVTSVNFPCSTNFQLFSK